MALVAQPAQKEIERGSEQWFQYYNTVILNEKWRWLSDATLRWSEGLEALSQVQLRTGPGYALSKKASVSIGYLFGISYLDEKVDRMEHRGHQQLVTLQRVKQIRVKHRYRVEERFFFRPASPESINRQSFNFRFRYSLDIQAPAIRLSATHPNLRLLFGVGNEIFLNAGKEVTSRVFDQNRLTFSTSLRINRDVSTGLTWNRQYSSTSTATRFRLLDIIWLKLKHRIR